MVVQDVQLRAVPKNTVVKCLECKGIIFVRGYRKRSAS